MRMLHTTFEVTGFTRRFDFSDRLLSGLLFGGTAYACTIPNARTGRVRSPTVREGSHVSTTCVSGWVITLMSVPPALAGA
jgi:hypothetical protein